MSRRLSSSVGGRVDPVAQEARGAHEPARGGCGTSRQRDLGQHLEALGNPTPVADPVVKAQRPTQQSRCLVDVGDSPLRTSTEANNDEHTATAHA